MKFIEELPNSNEYDTEYTLEVGRESFSIHAYVFKLPYDWDFIGHINIGPIKNGSMDRNDIDVRIYNKEFMDHYRTLIKKYPERKEEIEKEFHEEAVKLMEYEVEVMSIEGGKE